VKHWFIGDSVIVRHGDKGRKVRVFSEMNDSRRTYRVELHILEGDRPDTIVRREHHTDLINALRCGERWIP
jgi:hypothetical protein